MRNLGEVPLHIVPMFFGSGGGGRGRDYNRDDERSYPARIFGHRRYFGIYLVSRGDRVGTFARNPFGPAGNDRLENRIGVDPAQVGRGRGVCVHSRIEDHARRNDP